MLFSQQNAVFPLVEVGATATGNVELNSVNMALYDHAAFVLQFASTYAYVSAPVLTIESGSSDGADSADVTFHYRLSTGSAASLSTAAIYSAEATSSALTLSSAGDYAGHTLILEVDGDELRSTTAGVVYNWLQVDLGTNVSAGTMAAYAIMSNPRFQGASMPVAI